MWEKFEIVLSTLTLEDIIGLRLEIAARSVNYKLYGLDVWNSLQDIVKDGVLKYVYSAARTQGEMASFLGVSKTTLKRLLRKHKVTNYFSKS
mgnify:CR=1 FL=1